MKAGTDTLKECIEKAEIEKLFVLVLLDEGFRH